jgi:hypothetical protein
VLSRDECRGTNKPSHVEPGAASVLIDEIDAGSCASGETSTGFDLQNARSVPVMFHVSPPTAPTEFFREKLQYAWGTFLRALAQAGRTAVPIGALLDIRKLAYLLMRPLQRLRNALPVFAEATIDIIEHIR